MHAVKRREKEGLRTPDTTHTTHHQSPVPCPCPCSSPSWKESLSCLHPERKSKQASKQARKKKQRRMKVMKLVGILLFLLSQRSACPLFLPRSHPPVSCPPVFSHLPSPKLQKHIERDIKMSHKFTEHREERKLGESHAHCWRHARDREERLYIT